MAKYEDHLADADLKRQIIDDFSTALNYYMRRDGVRQQDLMNDLNLSSATVSTWVNGKRMPKPEAIKKLARYFHVSEGDMSRLPAWIDFAECGEADIATELYELLHMLQTINTVKVDGCILPDYIKQNLISAIKVAIEYAKEKNTK